MGGASRQGGNQPDKPEHHRRDLNDGHQDVSTPDDAAVEESNQQADGLEETVPPSETSVLLGQMTPTTRTVYDTQHRSGKNFEFAPAIPHVTVSFIKRPDSNGSDVQNNTFQFAPATNKNPVMTRPTDKRPSPSTLNTEKSTANEQVQHADRHNSRQGQTKTVNRQPLGSSQSVSDPPPSYQPQPPISSIEPERCTEKCDTIDDQTQEEEASPMSQQDSVAECDGSFRASSVDVPQHIGMDPRRIRSASAQATDVRTDRATLGSAVEDIVSPNEDHLPQPIHISDIDATGDQDSVHDCVVPLPETQFVPEGIKEKPPSTPAPKKTRNTKALVVPMHGMAPRVTKAAAKKQQQPMTHGTASPEEDVLSDENLLEILIVRQKHQKAQANKDRASADNFKTRIRTLNHSVMKLEREKDDIETDLIAARETIQHVSGDNESLKEQLDSSTGQYRKLKDFARVMANELKSLKSQADQNTADFLKLKEDTHTINEGARTAVSNTQALLKRHAKDISSVRQETQTVFTTLRDTLKESDDKSIKLKEAVAENHRLEMHIVGLQAEQQRCNRTAKEVDQQIKATLSQIAQQLKRLEAVVQAEPQTPAPLSDCLKLLQGLSKMKHVTSDDFGKLVDTMNGLDTTITSSFKQLDQTLKIPHVPDNREVNEMLRELKKTLEFRVEQSENLRAAETEVIRLEQQVQGNKELIEAIRQAQKTSEVHADAFKGGVAKLLDLTEQERQRASTQNKQNDGMFRDIGQLRIKESAARTDLGKCAKQRDDLLAERDRLSASLQDLQSSLNEETKKVVASEEEARASDEKARASEAEASASKEEARVSEEKVGAALEKARASEAEASACKEEAKISEEKARIAEEKAMASEEKVKVSEERVRASEENANLQKKNLDDTLVSTKIELTEQSNIHQSELSDLETFLLQAQNNAETAFEELSNLKSTHQQGLEKHQQLQNAYETLQQQRNHLDGECNGIKLQLQRHKNVAQELEDSQDQCKAAKAELQELQQEQARLLEIERNSKALQQTLQERIEELHSSKDKLTKIEKKVGSLQDQLDAANVEQANLQASLTASEKEAEKVPGLDNDLGAKISEVAELKSMLKAANDNERRSEGVAKDNMSLRKSLQETENDLNLAREKLAAQDRLERSLQEEQGINENLQARVHELEHQLQHEDKLTNSIQEKTATISQLQAEATETKRQLQDQSNLEALIRQKDQSIQVLQTKTKDFEQLKTAFDEMTKVCEEKDSNIQQLNSEIARHKEESQQLGEISEQLKEHAPDAMARLQEVVLTQYPGGSQVHRGSQLAEGVSQLTPNITLELSKDVDFSQPQPRPQPHKPDGSEREPEPEHPRRRAADRSGNMKPPRKSTLQYLPDSSQPLSSGSTNLVPNSQLEGPDKTLEFGDHGNSSSLSELEGEYLASDGAGSEHEDSTGGGVGVGVERARYCIELQVPARSQSNPERPSTAQSDLFDAHTTGLSGATARQSGRNKNGSRDSLFDINSAVVNTEAPGPKTVAMRDLQLNARSMLRRSQLDMMSPRKLRDGTQLRSSTQLSSRRLSTTVPEVRFNTSNVLNATPAPKRDKPQPNSAAKRSLEGEAGEGQETGSDKRLKRNPGNLEVTKPGPKPTPATPARSTTSSGSRKGGSIIGTNAPAPGGKPSKAPRKPSKRDKYVDRFNSKQSQQET